MEFNKHAILLDSNYNSENGRISFYCNASGEISVVGDPFACGTEDDLPPAALEVYRDFWTDRFYPAYVARYNGEYGLAMVALLDDDTLLNGGTAHNKQLSDIPDAMIREFSRKIARAAADKIAREEKVTRSVIVFYAEGADPDGDEFILFYPLKELKAFANAEAVWRHMNDICERFYEVYGENTDGLFHSILSDRFQYVQGDYVLTGVKNAFNDKTSYWMSKRDHVTAVYCFSANTATDALQQFKNFDDYCKYFDEVTIAKGDAK